MPKIKLPEHMKEFLNTEAGLFTIQCMLFVLIVGLGAAVVLPAI